MPKGAPRAKQYEESPAAPPETQAEELSSPADNESREGVSREKVSEAFFGGVSAAAAGDIKCITPPDDGTVAPQTMCFAQRQEPRTALGAEGPSGGYSAEVNVSGRGIYGFKWNPRRTLHSLSYIETGTVMCMDVGIGVERKALEKGAILLSARATG